jgi:putative endonuclease
MGGTIYAGVTANPAARVYRHPTQPRGFVARYGVTMLVHAEEYRRSTKPSRGRKAIKKWRREGKIELIEKANRDWLDLCDHLIGT